MAAAGDSLPLFAVELRHQPNEEREPAAAQNGANTCGGEEPGADTVGEGEHDGERDEAADEGESHGEEQRRREAEESHGFRDRRFRR